MAETQQAIEANTEGQEFDAEAQQEEWKQIFEVGDKVSYQAGMTGVGNGC